MPDFVKGTRVRVWVAPLTGNSRARPADAAFVRLRGITTSDYAIDDTETELTTVTYESVDEMTWGDGEITSKRWSLPFTANFRPDDAGYRIIAGAARTGDNVYIVTQEPNEAGDIAESNAGVAGVTGFRKTRPADGIITVNGTFTGRGAPEAPFFADATPDALGGFVTPTPPAPPPA